MAGDLAGAFRARRANASVNTSIPAQTGGGTGLALAALTCQAGGSRLLLEPEKTCWRRATAARAAVLIDMADYFNRVRPAPKTRLA